MLKHTINYSFRCEKCDNDSGLLHYEIISDVSKDDGFVAWAANAASFGASDALLSAAELKFAINRTRSAFEAGNYFGLNPVCPKCGHVQSWYQEPKMKTLGSLIGSVILSLCLAAIPLLILFLILFLIFEEAALNYLIIGFAIGMAAVAFFSIKRGVRELKENRRSLKTPISKPTVYWNDDSTDSMPFDSTQRFESEG